MKKQRKPYTISTKRILSDLKSSKLERNIQIVLDVEKAKQENKGWKDSRYTTVGKMYGLSKARIGQIYNKYKKYTLKDVDVITK